MEGISCSISLRNRSTIGQSQNASGQPPHCANPSVPFHPSIQLSSKCSEMLRKSSEVLRSAQMKSLLRSCCVVPWRQDVKGINCINCIKIRWPLLPGSDAQESLQQLFLFQPSRPSKCRCFRWVGATSSLHLFFVVSPLPHWNSTNQPKDLWKWASSGGSGCTGARTWLILGHSSLRVGRQISQSGALCPDGDNEVLHS